MRRDKGLTLIELIIAAAVFAVAALLVFRAIAHGPRRDDRRDASAPAAVAALRTVNTQQEIFRGNAVADQNEGGPGDYGLFGELAGNTVPRRVVAAQPHDGSATDCSQSLPERDDAPVDKQPVAPSTRQFKCDAPPGIDP